MSQYIKIVYYICMNFLLISMNLMNMHLEYISYLLLTSSLFLLVLLVWFYYSLDSFLYILDFIVIGC